MTYVDDIDRGRELRRQERGLSAIELQLLALLYSRLLDVLAELELAMTDGTYKHALAPLRSLAQIHTGAAVLRAVLEGE